MYLKCIGLKEQLLDVVNDLEATIKQILESLYLEKKLTDKELHERIALLLEQYNEKQTEFGELLGKVAEHQEREQYIRQLEEIANTRENLLSAIASQLKTIESSLVEGTFQAEKKLKSVKQSETNRVFSEDVIRFAHLISKHHSVASSIYWQQGDPARPFPTEPHFSVSNLLLSRTQPQTMPTPAFLQTGQMQKSAMFNVPGIPQQKIFTPNARPMFPPNMGPIAGTGSPRGRPPGSGARMASPRAYPKILQRTGSQQSPRFNLMMPGAPQMASASPGTSAGGQTPQQMAPGFMSPGAMMAQAQMMVNLPPGLKQQPQAEIPKVEQMSSSSSSSSSGDEGSQDER